MLIYHEYHRFSFFSFCRTHADEQVLLLFFQGRKRLLCGKAAGFCFLDLITQRLLLGVRFGKLLLQRLLARLSALKLILQTVALLLGFLELIAYLFILRFLSKSEDSLFPQNAFHLFYPVYHGCHGAFQLVHLVSQLLQFIGLVLYCRSIVLDLLFRLRTGWDND